VRLLPDRDWLIEWFCFLSERTHQTKIGSAESSIAKLLSGVMQGSGVGPLSFLTYTNELIDIMESCGLTIGWLTMHAPTRTTSAYMHTTASPRLTYGTSPVRRVITIEYGVLLHVQSQEKLSTPRWTIASTEDMLIDVGHTIPMTDCRLYYLNYTPNRIWLFCDVIKSK